MLWLNPFALFALAAVAAPILIHILIRRRAERLPFPTLRFLQPTRLASIRRHLLEDLLLLAIRMAVLVAAVAALAGPLFVTAARRQAWDRRIVRAVVRDGVAAELAPPARTDQGRPLREEAFTGASLSDGIRRAVLWLDAAPPARREIVVSSPLPVGALTSADISGIPAGVGIRFERVGTLPATRTVDAGRLLTPGAVHARQVTLSGDATSVRETTVSDPMVWPVDVVSSTEERPSVDAAIAAVLSQRVWAAPPDRRATLAIVGTAQPSPEVAQVFGLSMNSASPIQQPWMADAASRIARDPDVRAAAARVSAGSSELRFTALPWQALASAADGRPLVAVAGSSNRLLVASAAPPAHVMTPLLLRSIANAMAGVPDLQRAEVVPIPDAQLQRWSRPAAPIVSPRIENLDQDDRRWLWFAVLCLLGLEMWIRRGRRVDETGERREEIARVA